MNNSSSGIMMGGGGFDREFSTSSFTETHTWSDGGYVDPITGMWTFNDHTVTAQRLYSGFSSLNLAFDSPFDMMIDAPREQVLDEVVIEGQPDPNTPAQKNYCGAEGGSEFPNVVGGLITMRHALSMTPAMINAVNPRISATLNSIQTWFPHISRRQGKWRSR